MGKVKTILILSLIAAAAPHLGFPSVWKARIVTVTALLIAIISYFLFREFRRHESAQKANTSGGVLAQNKTASNKQPAEPTVDNTRYPGSP